jgi:hypothetical protein
MLVEFFCIMDSHEDMGGAMTQALLGGKKADTHPADRGKMDTKLDAGQLLYAIIRFVT